MSIKSQAEGRAGETSEGVKATRRRKEVESEKRMMTSKSCPVMVLATSPTLRVRANLLSLFPKGEEVKNPLVRTRRGIRRHLTRGQQ